MQIIESTVMGVRSAFIQFESTDQSAPIFQLFPMLHVADPDFYDEVSIRLEECDMILCEGVRSQSASLLTFAYRFFAKSPRLNLVVQNSMYLDHVKHKLKHADVAGTDFDEKWNEIQWHQRLLIKVLAPLAGIYMRIWGTRSDIAKIAALSLRKTQEEILASDDLKETMDEVILDWRDQHLINVIEEVRRENRAKRVTIGIMFGAAHMRAVIYHLSSLNDPFYRITKAEWMQVMKP